MKQHYQIYKSIDATSGSELSKVISFLRFPLIVAVAYIHCEPISLAHSAIGGGELLYIFVREILAGAAVPLFFIISGYLFFLNGDFSVSTYVAKLKKRIKTLLAPYILWNLIYWGIFVIKAKLMPGDASEESLTDLSPVEFLQMFWNLRSGFYPMCAQFWFLRDLMVVMIFSPIIYIAIKYCNYLIVGVLGLLWIAGFDWDITGLSISAFFFFSIGSYLAIRKINVIDSISIVKPWCYYIYPLLCLLALYIWNEPGYTQFRSLCTLVEIFCIVNIVCHCIKTTLWKTINFLSDSSFFIYAYHQIVLAVMVKYLVSALSPINDFKLIIIFLTAPVVVILVGLLIYNYMRKICPLTTKILTGGR